jgi:hypothetical protein
MIADHPLGGMSMTKNQKTEKTPLPRPISKKSMALLRGCLLALGAVCVAIGICFDGVQAVIANAIALCMSCIGLG